MLQVYGTGVISVTLFKFNCLDKIGDGLIVADGGHFNNINPAGHVNTVAVPTIPLYRMGTL